jgi:hypothetical protein
MDYIWIFCIILYFATVIYGCVRDAHGATAVATDIFLENIEKIHEFAQNFSVRKCNTKSDSFIKRSYDCELDSQEALF